MILYKKEKYMFGIFYARIRILIITQKKAKMLKLCAKNIYNSITFHIFYISYI